MASSINAVSILLLPTKKSNFPSSPSPICRKTDSPIRCVGISKRTRRKSKQKPPEKKMSVTLPISRSPSFISDVNEEGDTPSRNQLIMEKEAAVKLDIEQETLSSGTTKRKKRSYMSYATLFGVELSPDNVAVAMVYFVQGVLGLSRLAVSFYLKDDLHLDPAE
ncbi:folate-biopterin transporter 1 protein, partial [Thalictrum thalictroides]